MTHAFVETVYGKSVASSIAKKLEFVPQIDPSFDPFASIYGLSKFEVQKPILPPPPTSGFPSHWGILVYPDYVMLDAISLAIFPETISMRSEFPIKVSIIAPDLSNVSSYTQYSRGGQRIKPTHSLSNPPSGLDVLVVPGMTTAGPFPHHDELVAYIKKTHPSVKHIVSVGTGSMLLAAAGVLDGRKATTSKSVFEPATAPFRQANIAWTSGRWVRDGNVWTASGTFAGLDATNALCTEIFGERVAHDAAVLMEYTPRTNPSEDPFAEVWGIDRVHA